MAIKVRLERIMNASDLNGNDLAALVGITNVNLSRIKTGKICAFRFSTLNALCKALDCQPGDILAYVDDDALPEIIET